MCTKADQWWHFVSLTRPRVVRYQRGLLALLLWGNGLPRACWSFLTCRSSLFLCSNIATNLALQTTPTYSYLVTHSFCGSGAWACLSSGSPWVATRCGLGCRLTGGWTGEGSTSRPTWLLAGLGCWSAVEPGPGFPATSRLPSGPWHTALSICSSQCGSLSLTAAGRVSPGRTGCCLL